ncbi:DUF3367 domain-containing protein [Blastococcus sp. TF02-8]|uniref:alpha-(1->3)-arabinofuranosyltransferase n=1 Tax=Blastococcus sp. TF02-8 TaxID=2250574 RepID=UPI000DE80508|nr:alpha-(1->3)-arabinofuranosyltransferase [Blastococcus sp. TF02-8]RBY97735.1 DUF3367 domain-containing protein [Blastococcus sp. TF02-8]
MATSITAEPTGPRPVGSAVPQGGSAPVPPAPESRLLWRARLAVVCVGLTALALSQAPGRLVADTKLDLAVDPLAFLGRALGLWDAEGFAGQVQNQAYGYLFPMGPFFALGHALGMPMWLVQRLWWAFLLCAAFLGAVLLVRRLRIGTPAAAVVAGLAYALAPRMIGVLGAVSIEVLPMALAPWVLLPLVGADRSGSARRAALLSGVAVFCVGGVNAVATAAVLPLPALYLLTRSPGPVRRRLIAWWVAGVALATSWWAVPLLLLARYSPPFLDFIETAGTTTTLTDLTTVLRGASHWVTYLATPSGPQWPAGWSLARDTLPVAATVVLAVAGLVALTRRGLPERTWLVLGTLTGLVLVTLGHLATVQGLLAAPLHEALDGVLAPLRNVHKFEPVVRLPLAIGLAHLVSLLLRDARGEAPRPARRPAWWADAVRGSSRAVLVLLAVALVATVSPALRGRMVPPSTFADIPAYWREAADFLSGAQPSGRALLVPASSFATYVWGSTSDEPLQPLAESPWEVRNAIPLTPSAHIRVLDAVEERLARGEGSAGLTRYLARAGISHLVLRNDLSTSEAGSTRPQLVRQALLGSPGIRRAAGFGPLYPSPIPTEGLLNDAGLEEPSAAVEVFAVEDPAPRAWTAPLSRAVTVQGGPDALLDLEDRGLLTDRPTVLAGDADIATGSTMVSDALVRRERNFGRVGAATSAGLTADDPLRLAGTVPDYPVPGGAAAESVVRYIGGTPSAASSASDPDSIGGADPGASPWAAVDGDPTTAWRPALRADDDAPVWWRLQTRREFPASTVTVTLGRTEEDPPRRVRVTTDAGAFDVALADTDQPQRLPLPAGRTRSVTLAPAATPQDADGPPSVLALAEVQLPGVTVSRTVVTPTPEGAVDVYAFDAARPGSAGCLIREGAARCARTLVTGSEEPQGVDRTFTVDRPAAYDLGLTAVPRPGPALDALLARTRGDAATVTASSSAVDDPRASAQAVQDGDPATSWLAAPDDDVPTLELSWPEPRTVDSLRVVTTADVPAAIPTAVTIEIDGLPQLLQLDDDGVVRFPAVTTDRLVVGLAMPLQVRSYDPYSFRTQQLGVGVAEVEVGTENRAPDPAAEVVLPCGSGPSVTIDGERTDTTVRTTLGALTALQPVRVEACGSSAARLAAGEHRLVAASTDVLTVDSATLTRRGSGVEAADGGRRAADVLRWDDEHRRVEVAARDEPTVLVVPENTNAGWTATLDGRRLETVAVDGWQQGYVLPPGPRATVDLDFGPGSAYRAGLAAGAGAVLVLLVLAVAPARTPLPTPRPRTGRRSRFGAAAVVLAAAAGAALVGGVTALLALAALYALARLSGGRRTELLGWTAGLSLTTAGLLLLVVPSGTGTARQVLAVVAVAAVVAGVLPGVERRLRVPRRRTNG